jgi:hypothetical protein
MFVTGVIPGDLVDEEMKITMLIITERITIILPAVVSLFHQSVLCVFIFIVRFSLRRKWKSAAEPAPKIL